jgi:hypothetical protein
MRNQENRRNLVQVARNRIERLHIPKAEWLDKFDLYALISHISHNE